MKKKGLEEYVEVLTDPVIKKAIFIAVFIRLIPWVGFFLSLKYFLPFNDLIRNWNIFHVIVTLTFPIWLMGLYYLPNVRKVKNPATRMWIYVIYIYLIITPALVILAGLLTGNGVEFFKSYNLF